MDSAFVKSWTLGTSLHLHRAGVHEACTCCAARTVRVRMHPATLLFAPGYNYKYTHTDHRAFSFYYFVAHQSVYMD